MSACVCICVPESERARERAREIGLRVPEACAGRLGRRRELLPSKKGNPFSIFCPRSPGRRCEQCAGGRTSYAQWVENERLFWRRSGAPAAVGVPPHSTQPSPSEFQIKHLTVRFAPWRSGVAFAPPLSIHLKCQRSRAPEDFLRRGFRLIPSPPKNT